MKDFINKVIQGDAIEIMRQIPDNSVDMTFADPPFNLGKKYNSYYDKKDVDEYIEWCKLWLKEMVRITKATGSIFVHNIPRWLTYFASYLNEIAYFRHWIAWNAMGAPLGKRCYQTIMAFCGIQNSQKDSSFMIFVECIQDVESVRSFYKIMGGRKIKCTHMDH